PYTTLFRSRFLAPIRFRRMRTAMSSPPFPARLAPNSALEQPGEHASGPAAALAAQLFEQCFRLLELFEQTVDVLHFGAAAAGDAPAAAALDDGRVGPLLGRHGPDDGLHLDQLFLVHLQPLQLTGAGKPRN